MHMKNLFALVPTSSKAITCIVDVWPNASSIDFLRHRRSLIMLEDYEKIRVVQYFKLTVHQSAYTIRNLAPEGCLRPRLPAIRWARPCSWIERLESSCSDLSSVAATSFSAPVMEKASTIAGSISARLALCLPSRTMLPPSNMNTGLPAGTAAVRVVIG